MTYRLNFGNGQVQYCGSKKACLEMKPHYPGSFLEKKDWDTGEWFPL